MMGRPVDLGYQRIDVIEPLDDIDDIEVFEDNLQAGPWYVQVDAGDVRVISSEQVRDFLRLGVISERTYVWQQGMQHWLPLAQFLSPETPTKSAIHSELPTQPRASERPVASTQQPAPRHSHAAPAGVAAQKVTAAPMPATARQSQRPQPHSTAASHQSSTRTRSVAPPVAAQRVASSAPPPRSSTQAHTTQRGVAPPANSVRPAATGAPAPTLQQLAQNIPGTTLPQPRVAAAAPSSVHSVAAAAAPRANPAPAPVAAVAKPAASKFEVDEDEPFSVLMGPGEVKSLSLEQLVDFYRLEIIDDETHIWQRGMAEWTQLGTILGADDDEPEEDASNDVWFVQVAPGEIKTLSLDQLDDFYRLEVIDDNTLVCQPGWPQAYPLGMVAGLDAAPTVPVHAPVTTSAPARVQAAPAQPQARPAPVAVSLAPQPTATFMSNAPVAMSIRVPAEPPKRASWTLRLAVAAGLLLTLFRNDVGYSVADAVSQKGSYVQAEQRALGGPIFGTTRAVDSLLAETGGRLKPVKLPYIVTETQEKKAHAAKQASLAAAEAPKAAAPSPAPAKSEKATETKAAAVDSAPAAKEARTANVAAALSGAPTKKFAAVKTARKAAPAPKGGAKKGAGAGPFTGKGAYGDPLAM